MVKCQSKRLSATGAAWIEGDACVVRSSLASFWRRRVEGDIVVLGEWS